MASTNKWLSTGTRTNTATYPLSPGTLFCDFPRGKQTKFVSIINKFIVCYFETFVTLKLAHKCGLHGKIMWVAIMARWWYSFCYQWPLQDQHKPTRISHNQTLQRWCCMWSSAFGWGSCQSFCQVTAFPHNHCVLQGPVSYSCGPFHIASSFLDTFKQLLYYSKRTKGYFHELLQCTCYNFTRLLFVKLLKYQNELR